MYYQYQFRMLLKTFLTLQKYLSDNVIFVIFLIATQQVALFRLLATELSSMALWSLSW